MSDPVPPLGDTASVIVVVATVLVPGLLWWLIGFTAAYVVVLVTTVLLCGLLWWGHRRYPPGADE